MSQQQTDEQADPTEPEPVAWDSDDIFTDADVLEFPDVGVFVLPSGEGQRVGFRNIRTEHDAAAAVKRLVRNAYLAARLEFEPPLAPAGPSQRRRSRRKP